MTIPRPATPTFNPPRVRPVPAVTRAIAILRLLGRSRTPIGVKAIAQALDLVPSTCLHILRALVSEQLVKVDPATKRYSLGTGMLPLRAPFWRTATSPISCSPGSTSCPSATA